MPEKNQDIRLQSCLTSLLREQLSGFVAIKGLKRLTGGASRLMYRVEVDTSDGPKDFALRQNPTGDTRSDGRVSMNAEADLIRLAAHSGIPVPGVICTFSENNPHNDGFGDGYLMEWVDGETLGGRIVKSDRFVSVRPGMAAQCGEILGRIHKIDVDRKDLATKLRQASAKQMIDDIYEKYLELCAYHPMLDFAAHWLYKNIPETEHYALTHGDFRNGNFIVTEAGIAAVLDWELACLSDPHRDLAWLCVNSWRFGEADKPVGGFGELDDLFQAYEAQTGTKIDCARFLFWQVYGSFWWGITCLAMGNTYTLGLAKEADRPAIGRRSTEAQIDLVNLLIPSEINLADTLMQQTAPGDSNISELVESVKETLLGQFVPELKGRERFLAMVLASNAGIVLRELELGPRARAAEIKRLGNLLEDQSEDDLVKLRKKLSIKIREGQFALDNPALKSFLGESVAMQVAIDQPDYSGLSVALQQKV